MTITTLHRCTYRRSLYGFVLKWVLGSFGGVFREIIFTYHILIITLLL